MGYDDAGHRLHSQSLPAAKEKQPDKCAGGFFTGKYGLPITVYDQVRTKLLFTGEATINLKNALGNGELIGLDWQQLQQSSPKLNLQYQQPYLFGSPFGITTSFDLYKKDSSWLNINFLAGVQYALSVNQTGKLFIQVLGTNLLNVDTIALKGYKKTTQCN